MLLSVIKWKSLTFGIQLHTTYLNILLFAIFKNVGNHLGFVNFVINTKLSLVV